MFVETHLQVRILGNVSTRSVGESMDMRSATGVSGCGCSSCSCSCCGCINLLEVEHEVQVRQHVLSEGILVQVLDLGIGSSRWKGSSAKSVRGVEQFLGTDSIHSATECLLGKVVHGINSSLSAILDDQFVGAFLKSVVGTAAQVQQFVRQRFGGRLFKVVQLRIIKCRVDQMLSFVDSREDVIHALLVIRLLSQDLFVDARRMFQESCERAVEINRCLKDGVDMCLKEKVRERREYVVDDKKDAGQQGLLLMTITYSFWSLVYYRTGSRFPQTVPT